MEMSINLDNFLGNGRIVEILKRAIELDRLPHAMIFAGPDGIGKCTLAFLVAQVLNCPSSSNHKACGQCSSCKKIAATLRCRNLQCKSPKNDKDCGACSNCRLRMKQHPDIRFIKPEKTAITILQIRELIDEVAFQPFEARYRLAILDPADKMTIEAQNSLLKTLEEPPSRTIIILVTATPYILLETIRSRARLLQFGGIPRDAIEHHLVSGMEMPAADARLAASVSGGSLAAAIDFDTRAYREIRDQALHFVKLLLEGKDFRDASALAAQVYKDKQYFITWLDAVAALLQDIYYAPIAPDRIGQSDLREKLDEIARIAPRSALVSAIDSVRKLKGELQININRQLAIESLFLTIASH